MNFGSKALFGGAILLVCVLVSTLTQATAADSSSPLPFKVRDIRVEGLQRIPVERVYAALPIQAGDTIGQTQVEQAVKRLFATGNYEDVQLGRDGDDLVVVVAERPSVARIEITGNKSIQEEDLRKGLTEAGLTEGEVFQRSTLEAISGELERQYIAQGRYGADISTDVTPLPRNRVGLKINIYEGKSARISDINIVGNTLFSDEELLDQFELQSSHFWSFIKGDDKYSRQKLGGDLERLRSYYLDRGYINFSNESTQVSVTPDRERVQITINIAEGEQYTVNDVKLTGDLVVGEKELRPLVVMQKGQVFSQQLVTYTSDLIKRRLGNEGYTFAEVQGVEQDTGNADHTVDVTFFVDPGRRVYVRRIGFKGNAKTSDEVIRRELRQFENAPANTSLIDLSRERMQRLGFFSNVQADTDKVPGSDDLVDVDYTVEEQPSGSIGANVGYSDASGVIFGANVSQNNFRGTGNRVSFSVSRSDIRDYYSFSHYNPYYTLDGVSRGFSLFYSKIDFDEARISSYAADRSGGSVTFGYPISEYTRLNFGGTFERTSVEPGDYIAQSIDDFVQQEGSKFNEWKMNLGIRTSTLNRGVLPDRGWSASANMEVAVPGSDYLFYKVNLDAERYFPITNRWTLRAKGNVGFGDGYGDGEILPFFENYYSGGIGSVRGYESRSLGPRSPALVYVNQGSTDPDPDPIGGNFLTEATLELIFPTPFAPESRSVRTFLFADAGNVWETERTDIGADFDVNELRTSVGIGLSWLTAIGPLSFNLAKAFNNQPGDDTEVFQFSLGQTF
ncbi:outer membrane protein assembly factor BamA [Alloalcanivorax mobilis]|uniref:outer membrane protein assembly factor BamA n=1 Tax=Alloalcanivorax mobilis TaxID=2019569 RepID=UPI000B5B1F7D|nr:outer membrane protein assembly factor BamA [Alloalcanivorax mobilis]ASK34112.1 outer membrane protein assembly factor BamA [Alcanivorax sp. N3-2A]|tara:strand:+ start:16036 stop:18408 length:2373 start_codon:yes stop_codon:yes gene_type:complete